MSILNPIYPDKPNKNLLYCKYISDESSNRWVCENCGNYISKKIMGNNPPYSICKKSNDSIFKNRNNNIIISKGGVGTELKKILSKIGIKATSNCSCNARAKIMDDNGIEWCENNMQTICDWLKEEASKRKLPFVDMAGMLLIKRAIKNAKMSINKNK